MILFHLLIFLLSQKYNLLNLVLYFYIRKLLKITKKVNVTVCTDSLILDKNPEIDIFYSNKQTAEKLMNIANEEDVKIIHLFHVLLVSILFISALIVSVCF